MILTFDLDLCAAYYFYNILAWSFVIGTLEPSGGTVNAVREEESQSHAQAKSVSNADASLVASSSSSRLSKSEDKFEGSKGKRPRPHRRHQDPVPKDEEKKVYGK